MRYKRYIYPILMLAAMTAGLSACSVDTAADGGYDGADGEDMSGVRYLSMRVSTADTNNLAALDSDSEQKYKDGTEFEHAIDVTGRSENVIIFLDDKWTYQGYSSLEFDPHSSQGHDENFPAEAAYIGFLRPTEINEIYHLPEYGMMVLNAHGIIDKLKQLGNQATITDVLGLVDDSSDDAEGRHIAGRSGNYFTLSSAAYLVKEENVWKHSVVFKIDKSKIFDTRIQAVISPAATAIVERMAAKFTLSLKDPGQNGPAGGQGLHFIPDGGRAQVIVCDYVDGQPSYNNRAWTCDVSAWGINKYEPTSYYFRNIVGETTNTDSYPYTYGEDISATGKPFFNGWNNANHHRTFWAVDPNYDPKGGVFPVQFRAAVDNTQVDYFGKKGEPSLAYVSYNELSTDLSALESGGSATVYSTENTFPDNPEERLSGHWQHDLAGCEVVIGAQMHISGVNEERADYDLYRNRIGIFYPSTTDMASYFLSTINTQLASQSNMTYRYYDWDNPDNNTGTDIRTFRVDNSGYKIYYRNQPLTAEVMASLASQTIPATIENGDGKVIPWVNGMFIGRRNTDPNTYEEVGDVQPLSIDANSFKSLIYDWIGAFDHFNKGRMVYSVPVRYKAVGKDVSASNYRPTVGDYGVVRNSWYQFVIDGINSLGTPVDDPDQPIIPYETSLENSIMMEINVMDWHEFTTDVTLPDHIK